MKWRPVKDSSSKLRAPFHLYSAASPRQRGHDFLQARQLVLSSVFPVPPTTRVRSTRRVTRAVRCRDTSDRLLHPTYLPDLHPRSWLPTCLIEGTTKLFSPVSSRCDRRTWRFHDAVARFGGSCGKREGYWPSLYAPDTSSPLTSRHPRGPRSAITGRFAWKKVSLHPRI